MTETGRLGWVIAYVPDVAAAIEFYEQAFGLERKFAAEDGSYGELNTGQTTLAFASEELGRSNFDGGVQRPAAEAGPFNVEVVLVFDDVKAAYERATERGATTLAAPKEKPWGQLTAYVRDPFGTLVEIAAPVS
jgi:lactoylglutathione lyase